MEEEKKKTRRAKDVVAIFVGMVAFSASQVLGTVLVIPTILGFLSLFILVRIDKRLKARNKAFGGLGVTFAEDVPFKGLLSIELGHALWGLLGIGIYFSGAVNLAEIPFLVTHEAQPVSQ